MQIAGDEVHGDYSGADAHLGVNVPFYDSGAPSPGNSVAARVPASTEMVTITDLVFISTVGGTYDIVFYPTGGSVADATGLRIAKGNAQALGGVTHHFATPITGPQGYTVGLIAAAGQVDLVLTGYISRA
jgi:hypothetical protein